MHVRSPEAVISVRNRGDTHYAMGNEEAAFRGDPKSAHALYGRGLAAHRLGRASGKADMDRAMQMEPGVDRAASYGERP